MVAAARTMTAAEFAAIDEPGRYDLVDGVLLSMPAAKIRHGRFSARILIALGNAQSDGDVIGGELGFILTSDQRTILCSDVSFVRADRRPDESERGFFYGAPDLAVEVISDSERPSRVRTKAARYLDAGASVVWCVYPDERQIVVHRINEPPRILGMGDTLDAEPLIPGFRLQLAELFR